MKVLFLTDTKIKKMDYKTVDNYAQKVRNKVFNTFPSAIQFVPKCYKTQEMCDKVADSCRIKLLLFYTLYLILFLILKECVIKLFPKILLCSNIAR